MIRRVFGVDFSGARHAGTTAWIASAKAMSRGLVLESIRSLEELSGRRERSAVMPWLVREVARSEAALWGIDAPFALPVELFPAGASFRDQLAWMRAWPDGALAMGRHFVGRSLAGFGKAHVRRETDRVMRAPFDCYHYRVVFQTFHVMRDVLDPLTRVPGTAIVPFSYGRVRRARRIVLETCPSSTLKRLGLPYRGYKQARGEVTRERRAVRREILRALARRLRFDAHEEEIALTQPGGDALDAMLATVGAFEGWSAADHAAIARSDRATREGFIYA